MKRDGSEKKKLAELEKSNAYLGKRGNELCWSPDGKKLAYNSAGLRHYTNIPSPQDPPNRNEVMVVDRLLYKAFYYYSDLRRTYVWVISAEGGKPEQLSFGDYDYHSISWSPDGSKIAYLGRLRDHRSKESDAELHKIFVIPAEGGKPINLSASLDRWCMVPTWSRSSKKVYFTAHNSGRVGLYMAPTNGGKVTPVIEENGQVTSFCLGKKGEVFYVYTDFTHPEEIFRLNSVGGGKKKLTSLNEKITEEVEIIESERFAFPSFDGMEIEGWR